MRMGFIKQPEKAKLFTALLSKQKNLFNTVKEKLSFHFGPLEFTSPVYPWSKSRYYEKEMGTDLWRVFLFFERPVEQDALSDIKILTNELETFFKDTAIHGSPERPVNIDPGYLTLAKVVLASTKNYSHRIYIGKGIYAELTLFFMNKTFQPLPYTYPEYRIDAHIAMFNEVRNSMMHSR